MRGRCRLWLLALPVAAMLCVIEMAHAASVPRCAAIDRGTLPEPASCHRRFGLAATATPDALHALADAQMEIVQYGEASAALGCAATQLVDSDDTTKRYEWIRRRGVLAYRQERIADALGHFECALAMAEARGDRAAITKQLKNLGSALRRVGDYRNALRMLERGVQLMRADDDPAVGGMLSNIADVYREIDEPQQAERYYREAEEAFRRKGDAGEAAHVFESLSALALKRGDPAAATRMLETALRDVRDENDRRYQPGLYAGLAEAAIANGDVELAARHSANGLAIATQYELPIPLSLQLQAARADRMRGHVEQALVRLRTSLTKNIESDADRAALMEELASTLEQSGRDAEAIKILREAQDAERLEMIAKSDRQLAWLRMRFESDESQRTIAALQQRTLLLWLVVASTLAVLSALSLVFFRRQQRGRLEEAARRAQDKEMIARYQREADALSSDRDLLQTLLDSRNEAVCLLDAEGLALAANHAACGLLGTEDEVLVGRHVAGGFAEQNRGALLSALEEMEDCPAQTLEFVARDGTGLYVQLAQWARGDGLIVMELHPRNASPSSVPHDETTVSEVQDDSASRDARLREGFRCALVELMQASVETWERTTGTSRLELAEKSRIWRVNIDDGRLRARAMERYLAVSKLPQNPRWRDVMRSAYFVLTQCTMEPQAREGLQRQVDAVLAYTRRDASV